MIEPGRLDAPEPASLRLFFALWPDPTTRRALDRTGRWLQRHWDGRRMRPETIHLTLAFLGATPARRLDDLIACADGVGGEAYELRLDEVGYWRHNRIGWLGAREAPSRHFELVGTLNTALRQAGFSLDTRPHVPHITLLRNSAGGELFACTSVNWPIREFVLVQSTLDRGGARYEIIRRWPLA
ncbi:MAG TPA: RNA 2',3'-cyclic phosphodiesterase [Thiobacillaceae bacterium]|nr:RNA 2',3'-cyclic phosphodiesterase [Thiobacillaceae bacterium]